jgi:HAD superfamily hydrolase (TIGR01509 family)
VSPASQPGRRSGPAAVIFDLDGVLVDSELTWDEARRQLAEETGGRWHADATREMMGMSSIEWSRYMHDRIGVPMSPEEISDAVVERIAALYRERLPLLSGAVESVRALAERWPLAVASSSNRPVIDLVLELAGIAEAFAVTVSSEEVEKGKPAPDVYLEAARRLRVDPESCVAIEDSANGIRAAHTAGMAVIAIPNRDLPPDPKSQGLAARVLTSLEELTPELVVEVGGEARD